MADNNWKVSVVKNEIDEDKLDYVMYDGNKECGRAEIEILYDSYEYEFAGILTSEEFEKEFVDRPIIKINRLEIDPAHRERGMGRYLLSESINRLRLLGFNQWFLNASPLDDNGPKLKDLERFYSQFGFHKKQMREESTLMWFKD